MLYSAKSVPYCQPDIVRNVLDEILNKMKLKHDQGSRFFKETNMLVFKPSPENYRRVEFQKISLLAKIKASIKNRLDREKKEERDCENFLLDFGEICLATLGHIEVWRRQALCDCEHANVYVLNPHHVAQALDHMIDIVHEKGCNKSVIDELHCYLKRHMAAIKPVYIDGDDRSWCDNVVDTWLERFYEWQSSK